MLPARLPPKFRSSVSLPSTHWLSSPRDRPQWPPAFFMDQPPAATMWSREAACGAAAGVGELPPVVPLTLPSSSLGLSDVRSNLPMVVDSRSDLPWSGPTCRSFSSYDHSACSYPDESCPVSFKSHEETTGSSSSLRRHLLISVAWPPDATPPTGCRLCCDVHPDCEH